MPIFISYSRKDRDFVDKLVVNLVRARHSVWMDRWELGVGDSLTQRIQDALKGSAAVLVILSKHSVDSEWCKRELTAGLVRELEEKHTVVMPCVIDDCEIPLFLRDKLYADFRSDPDQAFSLLDQSLSKISNPNQGRIETPDFFTDFSLDWGGKDRGSPLFRMMFVDHGKGLPYVIWSLCEAFGNTAARENFFRDLDAGRLEENIVAFLKLLDDHFKKSPLSELITDNFERYVVWPLKGPDKVSYVMKFSYRRLGIDNGFDTLVHLDKNIQHAFDHYKTVLRGKLEKGGEKARSETSRGRKKTPKPRATPLKR
jgi:hypothetical protein